MKEETKNVKIFSLKSTGKIYFIYSDKFAIFFFYYDIEEDKLYKITTDKFFTIEYIDEIVIPDEFKSFKDIKFFKPFKDNIASDYNFNGIIITDKGDYKFTIEPNNYFKIINKTEYIDKSLFNLLTCLSNFKVISYIQKSNKIYLIAYDKEYSSYIYGIVDIEKDKFQVMYSLLTDEGYIVPLTINTDSYENRVLIGGYVKLLDNNDKLIGITQYIEQFFLILE